MGNIQKFGNLKFRHDLSVNGDSLGLVFPQWLGMEKSARNHRFWSGSSRRPGHRRHLLQETDNTTSALMYIFVYIYIYYYENHHGLSPKKWRWADIRITGPFPRSHPTQPHDHYKPWFKMTMNKLVAGPCPVPLSINNGGSYICHIMRYTHI